MAKDNKHSTASSPVGQENVGYRKHINSTRIALIAKMDFNIETLFIEQIIHP